jgi:ABC-2 type transport system permease protein
MMNLMRADVYRIVRGKTLYVSLAVLLAVIILQAVSGGTVNTGLSYHDIEMLGDFDPENFDPADFFVRPTGAEAPFKAMGASGSLLYLMLPLLSIIAAGDFYYGAAKNTLASGVSRVKYYFSKLFLSCIVFTLLFAVYILLSMIVATAVSGFGGEFDRTYISGIVKVFLPQLWLCLAFICVGNFFVFLMRSGGFIGILIAFLLGPSILIFALTYVNDWFNNLFDYELTLNIGKALYIESMPAGDIAKMILIGAGYLVAATAGGFMVFKRAEIK